MIITSMITDDTKSCYQLMKTMTKFEKETGHRLYVFKKTKYNSELIEVRDTARALTRSVHSHKHDLLAVPLTVLLHHPITSMTRILPY